MGMPIINLDYIDRDDALNSIIASIALQEAALAHILNADGEKLQAAVKLASSTMMSESYPVTLSDLIDVNESVNDLVETVADIEGVLREKLTSVLSYIQTEEELFPNSVPVNLIVTGGTEPIVAAFSASAHVAVPADALVREEEGETRNYNIVRQIETKADGTATIDLPVPNLEEGESITYTIRQIIASNGHKVDEEPKGVDISLTESGYTASPSGTLEFTQTELPTSGEPDEEISEDNPEN